MILASDLDRTLIYSTAAIDQLSQYETDELYTAEIYEGKPFSFMTKKASILADELIMRDLLVPVTTRIRRQYDRITLSSLKKPKWAVIANGAEVLRDGVVDKVWHEHISDQLKNCAASIEDVENEIEQFMDTPWLIRKRTADSWFIYLIINRELLESGTIETINAIAEKNSWQISIQGRKLYLVPNPVNKMSAISYVCEQQNVKCFVAAGDSLLDQSLVDAADIGFIPAHGELYNRYICGDYKNDELKITEESGIRAGEEILRYALQRFA